MPPCVKCGFWLPDPCAACPPGVYVCPKCGEEQLLEPSAEAVAAYLETRDVASRVRRDIENLGDMKDLLAEGNRENEL